jgi:hypothetical protein
LAEDIMNENKRHSLNYNCLIFIIVLFNILSFMGCVSGWVGKTVPLQNRIAIKDEGPHQGSWTRPHATFDYMYTRTSGQLGLIGDISIDGLRGRLISFHFWLHFIDENGTITESLIIFSSNANRKGAIKKDLNLPIDTSALAFSYTGNSEDKMTDGRQTDAFHSSPLYLKKTNNP